MVEYIQEHSDIWIKPLLEESKQNLSDLKKDIYDENLETSEKFPPNLKKLYERFLTIKSPKDIDTFVMDRKEFRYFSTLFQEYIKTKTGRKVQKQLELVFGAKGAMDIHEKKIDGLKLVVLSLWGKELFAINNTIESDMYYTWRYEKWSIVVDCTSDHYYIRDVSGNKLQWRYSIMPDGNLALIDQNGKYLPETKYFWDLSFSKLSDTDFTMNFSKTPNKMLEDIYKQKKAYISNLPEIKTMVDEGYLFEWNDYTKTVEIRRSSMASKASDDIMKYATDEDFLAWIRELKFKDFYNIYFNDSASYKKNNRYEIIKEGATGFFLLDKENGKESLSSTPFSILDESGRLIDDQRIDIFIEKYEAEQVYLKFIAENNKEYILDAQGNHMEHTYYLWYAFPYRGHTIQIERNLSTKRKYALVVRDGQWTYTGTVYLDKKMKSKDIEREIDALINK